MNRKDLTKIEHVAVPTERPRQLILLFFEAFNKNDFIQSLKWRFRSIQSHYLID